jgi:predicted MFS family arabinose efflux permease
MSERLRSFFYPSLVFAAIFSGVATDSGIIPQFETIGSQLRVTTSSMLGTLTSYNAAFVLGLIYGSFFSEKKHIPIIFQTVAVSSIVGLIGILLIKTYLAWLSFWAVLGIGSGLLSHVTWEFTLGGGHSDLVQSRLISAQLSARPIGLALGVPIFTFLGSICNWESGLALFVLLTVGSSVILGLAARKQSKNIDKNLAHSNNDESLFRHYKTIGHSELLSLVIGNFFYGMSYLALYGVLGIILGKLYGFSAREIGYLFGLMGAVEGASSFLSPLIFSKFKGISVIVLFSCLSGVALLLSFTLHLPSSLFVLLLAVFVFGARQLIYAGFKGGGEFIATLDPSCPIGTFIIIAAWSGFSLSSWLLEKAMGTTDDISACAILIISTYLLGLFFLTKFFRYNFKSRGLI